MAFNKNLIKKNVLLKDFVTFKLGGPAEFFYEARSEQDLIDAINYARQNKINYFLLGGGSNLVVSDEGIDGLVILNTSQDKALIDVKQNTIKMSSGFKLKALVDEAYKNSFTGLEYLTGIPGSIGGAVYGNAGAYGKSIGDILVSADVIFPDGSIQTVPNSFFNFSYRNSRLKQENYPILSVTVSTSHGNRNEIRAKMDDIIKQREQKHPPIEVGCAGSFFKNLPPLPGNNRRRAAGSVLERAGAKSMKYGGASVFQKHANFIINNGNATAKDIKILAQKLKEKVYHDFGIELSEEVRFVGK